MTWGMRLLRVLGCIGLLALVGAAPASAGEVLLKAKIPGNDKAGGPATLGLDLKTSSDGAPRSFISIVFSGIDYHCMQPTLGPTIVDYEIRFSPGKLKRHGHKYTFAASEGGGHMEATISKDGSVAEGTAHFEFTQGHGDPFGLEDGSSCVADAKFKAKAFYKSRTAAP